ncbi:cobalamin biosynthesis protein [Granulicoccus sp. GXG6511]|uniref:cobalamin biosynthesis protein n=1 Tax=Granulicoccus sp. GXG6511 TaxID=3381351 RepID=UPI003D7EE1B3
MHPLTARAAGLVLGWLADEALGDPARRHPVAGFGTVATALERRTYADTRSAGVRHLAVLLTATVAASALLDRATRRTPLLTIPLTAAATWTVLGGRSLRREANAVREHLDNHDLPAARTRIRSLVGRDPTNLTADELARATVESVAENTSDAVVAPLFWGAVAGIPGLLTYRAVNTLDAMIGHRNARYRHFGWAAARLDDAANWLPARLAALLTAVAAPVVGGSATTALRTVRADAHRHPSPNAGPVEAAFAGALGVRLGGVNEYAGLVEDRGTLGDGPPVTPADIPRANRLAATVTALSCLVTAAFATIRTRSGHS